MAISAAVAGETGDLVVKVVISEDFRRVGSPM
jgi:hypothetical protein